MNSTWNHRLIRHDEKPDDVWIGIHECHYGDDQRIPHSWTAEAIPVMGETIYEIRESLARLFRATEKPILVIRGGKLEEWEP